MTLVKLSLFAFLIAVALLVSFRVGQVSVQQRLKILERHDDGASTSQADDVTTKVVPSTPSPTAIPQQFGKAITALVNEYRVQNNLSVLTESVPTCSIASGRLIEIKSDYSHTGFYKFGSTYDMPLSENIARNFFTPESVVDGWLKSPTHKENLDKPWTHMCIATDGVYVVQIFSF